MRWSDVSISRKLYLGFGAVLAAVMLVGLVGLSRVSGIASEVREMYLVQLASVRRIADVRTQAAHLRIVLQHIYASTPTARDQLAVKIRAAHDGTLKGFADLEAMPLPADEQRALAGMKDAYLAFARVRDERVLAASTAGRREEALALADGDLETAYRALTTAATSLEQLRDKAAHARYEDAAAASGQARMVVIGLLFGDLALGAFLAVVIARSIVRPIGTLRQVLARAAAGDLTARSGLTGRDEIRTMATDCDRMLEGFDASMVSTRTLAEATVTASRALAAASLQLAGGTQQEASALQQTAASLEEITGSVRQTADGARHGIDLATASGTTAEQGGHVVTTAIAAMDEITKSSRRIADITTAIDEIAFQTNLLALNAAVEAARAGVEGRGFAVVAAEVRNLAQRAATAAGEIKTLIQDSVGKVQAGAELVGRSGATLEEIVVSVKRVTDVITEIAAASQEQSAGIEQVNRAVTQMDEVVHATATQTDELNGTAQRLSAQATELAQLVARFTVSGRSTQRGTWHAPISGPRARTRGARPAPVEEPALV